MEKNTSYNYSLEESPLYGLTSKDKLANVLNIHKKEMIMLSKVQPYNSFVKRVGTKTREIDEPRKRLKLIQGRIKGILSRVETPDWLFSGKRGVSYLDNAKFHLPATYVITCDIKSFYPSCTRERIFQIFKYTFKIVDDVAWLLADLLSFREKIPTGSPSSQIIAFWAYYPTFTRIHKIVMACGGKISLYVDDITISNTSAMNKDLVKKIDNELRKVNHSIKESKTKFYGKNDFKLITGVAVSPSGHLKVPNKIRIKLLESLEKNIGQKSIVGQIRSSQNIEPNYCKEMLAQVRKKNNLLK